MTGFLAPRNVGYKASSVAVSQRWAPKGTSSWINSSGNVVFSAHFKSPVVKSDRRVPTDYTRMIAKLVPFGAVDASNSRYVFQSTLPNCFSIKNNPYGCNLANGSVAVPSWMTDKVVQDAVIELNQLTNNILEDLGQLKQTGDLLARIFKAIVTTYVAMTRRNFKYVRQSLREFGVLLPRRLSEGWLMYFYGIRPLISTFVALATSEQPVYKTLKVRKRVTTASDPRQYVNWMWNSTYSPYWHCHGKGEMNAQCQITAQIKMDSNMATLADLGLSGNHLVDAVVTAWALVPYSFVVDWILPIENYLRSLSWSSALVFHHAFVGSRHKVISAMSNQAPLTSAGPYPYGGQIPKAILQILFYQRKVSKTVPPPTGVSLKLTLNPTQVISAAALIIAR